MIFGVIYGFSPGNRGFRTPQDPLAGARNAGFPGFFEKSRKIPKKREKTRFLAKFSPQGGGQKPRWRAYLVVRAIKGSLIFPISAEARVDSLNGSMERPFLSQIGLFWARNGLFFRNFHKLRWVNEIRGFLVFGPFWAGARRARILVKIVDFWPPEAKSDVFGPNLARKSLISSLFCTSGSCEMGRSQTNHRIFLSGIIIHILSHITSSYLSRLYGLGSKKKG